MSSTLVLFYATWCPACEAFLPEWKEATRRLRQDWSSSDLRVKTYEDKAKTARSKRDEWNVTAYPTVLLIDEQGQGRKVRARSADGLVRAVEQHLG